MIDLKKIAQKLDEVLESETTDSLTQWLMSKRAPVINKMLGKGSFVSLETRRTEIVSFMTVTIKNKVKESETDPSDNFPIAA